MKNEIDLSLCLWQFEDITHEEITALTGLQPFKVFVKGERKSKVSTALCKENGWIYKPPLQDKYATFEQQMTAMLDVIETKIEAFKFLCEKCYCEFSCALFIYTDTEESTPWVHLDSRYNSIIKELNIEFDVDMYLFSTEDS
jgi:hypothetical protein